MIKTQILNLLLIISLVACSHKSQNKADYERLTTYIDEQGQKQFQFSATMSVNHKRKSKGSKGQGKGGNGPGRRGGGEFEKRRNGVTGNNQTRRSHEKMINKLYVRLEHQLSRTRYCREGFIETDQFSEAGAVFIEGRCHDKATAEDRVRFENQLP